MMSSTTIIGLVYCFISLCNSEIVVKNTGMRPPKHNDVGLIFDLSVTNTGSSKKETLDFHIRCKKCCLIVSANDTLCEATKLVGGDFGQMMPNEVKTISLIWPTVTLVNRIGYCDITVTVGNQTGGKTKISDRVQFNTSLDQKNVANNLKSLVSGYNVSQCKTIDLHPLMDCIPVNCQEKYFGQRNFFNTRKNICETVPKCSNSNKLVYDYTINECVNLNQIICQEDLLLLQQGKFDNTTWEPEYNGKLVNKSLKEIGNNIIIPDEVPNGYEDFPWNGFTNAMLMIFTAIIIYLILALMIFSMVLVSSRKPLTSRKHSRER